MPLLKPQQEPEKEEPVVTVEQVIAHKSEGFLSALGKTFRKMSKIHAPAGLKEFGRSIWLGQPASKNANYKRWSGKNMKPYTWNWSGKKRRKR